MESDRQQTEIQNRQMAEEFGIYPWRYQPCENTLWLGEGAAALLGSFGSKMAMEDFLQLLAPESLSRFTAALEDALNFGKPIRMELLAETSPDYRWLQVSGRSENVAGKLIVTGFIKDLSKEKSEKERLSQLENWLSAGVRKLRVSDAGGELLAAYGSDASGPNVEEGPGSRRVKLVDFRNQLKYLIETETGSVPIGSTGNAFAQQENPLPAEAGLDLKLSREERFVSLTRALGLRTDAQVSALGVFDGSRFEWKAWWKSPGGTAVPAGKYGGEWLPDLSWLIEMEAENRQFTERYWWPQDMLPFPIADAYGKGWMLLTDHLAGGQTGLLALRCRQPEGLMQRKEEVLGLLRYLHDEPDKFQPEESVEKLREEIVRREMLLKEMNHRAKNNLALAAGLVKMQAGFSEDKKTAQFLKQTQKRLETLATLHELMYANPGKDGKIEIAGYLEKLIHGLHSSFGHAGIQMELQLDAAEINIRYANTIGLLVNEIVSNAYKHAFSGGRQGKIRVDFLGKGESFKLLISDDGPGFDESQMKAESLGSMLIDEFVKQLGAEMEIIRNSGTTYLISIKKSNIGL